ncbi:MAG TPA: hypothetical protein VFF80_03095 [Bacillota bacterium]|nr:hypothetical protein [Bacillota bacterium]
MANSSLGDGTIISKDTENEKIVEDNLDAKEEMIYRLSMWNLQRRGNE